MYFILNNFYENLKKLKAMSQTQGEGGDGPSTMSAVEGCRLIVKVNNQLICHAIHVCGAGNVINKQMLGFFLKCFYTCSLHNINAMYFVALCKQKMQ